MRQLVRWSLLTLVAPIGLWLLHGGLGGVAAAASAAPTPPAPGDRRAYDPETGRLSYLGFDPGRGPVVGGAMAGRSMAAQGELLLAPYAAAFGLRDHDRQLRLESANEGSLRFQQIVDGFPVVAGELIVSVSEDGGLESISGEISPDPVVADSADVSPAAAASTARDAVAKWYGLDESTLDVSEPERWVLDESLLYPSDLPAALVWRVIVTAGDDQPIREYVFVDAVRGSIPLHWNQIDTAWNAAGRWQTTETPTPTDTETPTETPSATPTETTTATDAASATASATPSPTDTPLPTETASLTPTASETAAVLPTLIPFLGGGNRMTYSADNTTNLTATLRCTQAQPTCTDGADPHADAAHLYAANAFDFYDDHHGRDSVDGAGMTITSSVHYQANYFNAFWNGTQMVYGDGAAAGDPPSSWTGYPMADDVVGHELTHGVTQYESNLYYYYQSGAINESFSDIWGEYIDQTNGAGNDSAGVKWLIGEDITRLGAFRSMSNPPAYGDPDRMTSSLYYKGSTDIGTFGDNGGVHTNSGVGNKAAFLMTDGGTFNGYTVGALGIDKSAAIFYEAQANLLTSGSDYFDLYHLLFQACQNLIGGPQGISAGDCLEVRDATNAVEMNLQPAAGYNPDPAACPAGTTRDETLFSDDLESGSGNWLVIGEGAVWKWATGYAVSGTHMLWGDDAYAPWEESSIAMASDELLPAGAFLRFDHAFGFEDPNFDGGVLEFSSDAGANWNDAAPLFSDGRSYSGTISGTWGNALGGRSAFVADSHGYVGSRYNLSTLAGQSIRFRWRMATDGIVYDRGWLLDNVEIYTCVGAPGVPSLTSPANNALVPSYTPNLDWADAASADHYQIQVASNNSFSSPVIDEDVASSNFTPGAPLADNTTYWWRVRTVNILDQVSAWSTARTFRTSVLTPILSSPSDTEVMLTTRPVFDWGNVAGASNYTIQVSTVSNFASTTVNSTVTPSTYTPTVDLTPKGATLYWRVRANGTNGPSAWSTVRSLTSANPPSVPSLTSPANNALQLTYAPVLDWGDSTNSPDHYQVQISANSGFGAIVRDEEVTPSTWTVAPDLNPGTTYWWRVRSFNAAGQYSQWSSVRTLRTVMAAPSLVTPVDLEVMVTTRPTFDWGDVTGASSYTIQVSTVSNFASTVLSKTASGSQYTPTVDLTPKGATLYWRVRANGTNGPSAWSSIRSLTSANPPSVPSLTSPANNALQLTYAPVLDWTNSTNSPDHYQVQLSTNSSFGAVVQDATPSGSTYTASPDLTPNTTYWWRVRSFNAGGQYSQWSSVRTLRTVMVAPTLSVPADLEVMLTTRPVFDWGNVAGASNYTIQVSTVSNFASTTVNSTVTPSTYTPTVDLTPKGATLYWRVRANGTNGPSAWSTVRSLTSANPPSVPSLTSPANNALQLTYAPVLDWGDSTNSPDHYQVQISANSGFGAIVRDEEVTPSTWTVAPDLNPGTTYWWRVRSFNAAGQYSQWSSVRTLRTVMAAPSLVTPVDLEVMVTTRPTFDWGDVTGASSYTIQVSTVSNFASTVLSKTASGSQYTPTVDLTPKGATLYWRVRANGTNGPSAWSVVRSLTSANPPSVPSLTSPANNALQLTYAPVLDWTDSTNSPDHYQVQLSTNSSFGAVVQDATPSGSTYTASPDLTPNTTYWWRVRSFNAGGQYSQWSSVRTLRTVIIAPSMIAPTDASTVTSLRPVFDWTDVAGATSYTLQASTNNLFSALVINASPTTSTYTPSVNLATQKVFDVRVRANGPNGPSAWSPVISFIIIP